MRHSKKGQIDSLSGLVIGLVAIGLVLTVGFLIMAEALTQAQAIDTTGDGFAENGTRETINAMSDIPGWLSIVVVAVIGVTLLGLVARFRRT